MPVSPELKAALAPGKLVKTDNPAVAAVLNGTMMETITFKPEDLGKISGTLSEQLALKLFGESYGAITDADQKYFIVTLEAILENHNVDPSKIHSGDTFRFNFTGGTYSVDRGGDGQNVKEGEMKVAERIQNLEGTAPEKLAAAIDSLERGGLLVKALQQYKEDPSYNGRVAFIEAHKDVFVDLLNHYLPASSTEKFSADAPHFAYKQTDNVTQNIAYLKAYLNLKRHEQLGTPLAIEVVAPAAPAAPVAAPESVSPTAVSPEMVGAPGATVSPESVPPEAETMPTMPAGAPTAAPVESTEVTDSRVDALATQVQSLATELDQASGSELFTPKGHEHLRELRARAIEMRKHYNELLPNATDADSIKKLHRIDLKLRTAERFSIVMLFKGPKEKIVAPSLESIKNFENLTPDQQVDVLASVVDMLNTELLFTYGIEMITEKGRAHFRNLRTTTIAMRTWHDELVPKVTDDASTRKLRDIDQDLRKAQGYVDMLYSGIKEKVEPVEPAASSETPVTAPAAVPEESTDVASAEHVRLSGEMGAHARRNAWAGVEADFKNLTALPGETPSYDEYMLGAQAALNQGNMLAARDRFREADALQPEGRAQLELDTISKNYAEVQLSSNKPGTLVPIDRPFDPVQRAAIDFAAKQIRDGESFDGLLPRGDYTFNGNKITVGAAPAEVEVPVSTIPLATDWTNIQPESQVRAAQLMTDAPAPAAEAQPEASTEASLAAKKAGEALGIRSPLQMDAEGLEIDTNTYYTRSMEAPRDFAIQYDVPGEPQYLRVTYNKPEVDRDGRIKTTIEFKTVTGDVIRMPVETELPNRATIDAYLKAQNKAGRPLDFAKVAARIAWERYSEALQIVLKTVKPTVDAGYAFWQITLHGPAAGPAYTEDEVVAPPAGPRPTSGPIDFDFDDGYVAPEKTPEVARAIQKVHLENPGEHGLNYNGDHRVLTAAETAQIHAADAALQEGHVYDGELPTGDYMMDGDPFTVEKVDGVFTYKTAE